jgi:hypothetical protein
MSMHVPALDVAPIADETDIDQAAALAERRREFIETLITTFVVVVTITFISVVGVALELG